MDTILLKLNDKIVELLNKYGYFDTAELNGKYISKKQYKEAMKDISNARREEDADLYYFGR